jgi:hypothetical protein
VERLYLPTLHSRKNAAKDLAPTGFDESGAGIAFSFLGRNVMGLGGIKIGDYSEKLLDKDFFNIFLNFYLGRNSDNLLEMLGLSPREPPPHRQIEGRALWAPPL